VKVNFLLFEGLTQLDLTGPYEVLVRAPRYEIEMVAKQATPVRSDRGLTLLPTQSISNASVCDLFVVPGGPGTDDALGDPEILQFVREQAAGAKYVFGICTGSLLLGAAGLLRGRRSTCHWQAIDFLPQFGAIVERKRMVVDGNLFTAGGVTSGIDMALKVVALLSGEDVAKQIQLQIEYDPEPPFVGGTPGTSEQRIVERCLQATASRREYRAQAVQRAVAALGQIEEMS
jgi:cyclohexyl-isocyanide hydratase